MDYNKIVIILLTIVIIVIIFILLFRKKETYNLTTQDQGLVLVNSTNKLQIPTGIGYNSNTGTLYGSTGVFDIIKSTSRIYDKTGLITPVGSILPFAGTYTPTGFLLCDGSPVNRTTYNDLFLVIGTSWGAGDNTNTFNLPDLRGNFLRGLDDRTSGNNDPENGSRTALNPGGNTGRKVGSYQWDSFKAHRHPYNFNVFGSGAKQYLRAGRILQGTDASGVENGLTYSGSMWLPDGMNTSNNSENGSETRPKNVAVNYIIKY